MQPTESTAQECTDRQVRIGRRTRKILEVKKRERDALDLRLGGFEYAEIGERIGLTESGAYRAVERAIDRITKPAAEELRMLALARIDAMLRSIWLKVLAGNLGAIDRAIKLEEMRARKEGTDRAPLIDLRGMVARVAAEYELDDDESSALFSDIQKELTAAALRDGDAR